MHMYLMISTRQQFGKIHHELLADSREVKLVLRIVWMHQIVRDFMRDREVPSMLNIRKKG